MKVYLLATLLLAVLVMFFTLFSYETDYRFDSYSSRSNSLVFQIELGDGWQSEASPGVNKCLAVPHTERYRGVPFVHERSASPCGWLEANSRGKVLNLITAALLSAAVVTIPALIRRYHRS